MNHDELVQLRTWADGLARDGRVEVRAAARAIQLLADEVERMRNRLADAGKETDGAESQTARAGTPAFEEPAAEESGRSTEPMSPDERETRLPSLRSDLESGLRRRLGRISRRSS